MEQDILLQMVEISKSFPGVKALDKVSLNVHRGTVHALMGENGAGKSTLMKCLFGMYNKDGGHIYLEGREINFKNSRANKTICAVSALYKAFNKLGVDAYVEMLTAIRDTWQFDPDSVCAPIINAMTTFYKTYGGNFKRADLVNSLKRITPAQIIREGRTLRMKNGFAREIVKSYNKGRKYKLDIEKL